MASVIKRAIKHVSNAFSHAKWEHRPLSEHLNRKINVYEIALEIYQKLDSNPFRPSDAYWFFDKKSREMDWADFYHNYGWLQNIWYATLFKDGVIERKPGDSDSRNRFIYEYRFRKEGVDLIKQALASKLRPLTLPE